MKEQLLRVFPLILALLLVCVFPSAEIDASSSIDVRPVRRNNYEFEVEYLEQIGRQLCIRGWLTNDTARTFRYKVLNMSFIAKDHFLREIGRKLFVIAPEDYDPDRNAVIERRFLIGIREHDEPILEGEYSDVQEFGPDDAIYVDVILPVTDKEVHRLEWRVSRQ
jgi:hypothetical protein